MSTSSIRTVLFDIAPSLETEDSDTLDRINRFISRATNAVNEDAAGDQYDEAVALLTWHNLLISDRDTAGSADAGVLSSEKMDNAQYSYATPGGSGGLSETTPGRQFLKMQESWIYDPWDF